MRVKISFLLFYISLFFSKEVVASPQYHYGRRFLNTTLPATVPMFTTTEPSSTALAESSFTEPLTSRLTLVESNSFQSIVSTAAPSGTGAPSSAECFLCSVLSDLSSAASSRAIASTINDPSLPSFTEPVSSFGVHPSLPTNLLPTQSLSVVSIPTPSSIEFPGSLLSGLTTLAVPPTTMLGPSTSIPIIVTTSDFSSQILSVSTIAPSIPSGIPSSEPFTSNGGSSTGPDFSSAPSTTNVVQSTTFSPTIADTSVLSTGLSQTAPTGLTSGASSTATGSVTGIPTTAVASTLLGSSTLSTGSLLSTLLQSTQTSVNTQSSASSVAQSTASTASTASTHFQTSSALSSSLTASSASSSFLTNTVSSSSLTISSLSNTLSTASSTVTISTASSNTRSATTLSSTTHSSTTQSSTSRSSTKSSVSSSLSSSLSSASSSTSSNPSTTSPPSTSTPSPVSATFTSSSTPVIAAASSSPAVSGGQIAGIAIGSTAGALLIVVAILFLLRRRKQNARQSGGSIYPELAYLYDPPIPRRIGTDEPGSRGTDRRPPGGGGRGGGGAGGALGAYAAVPQDTRSPSSTPRRSTTPSPQRSPRLAGYGGPLADASGAYTGAEYGTAITTFPDISPNQPLARGYQESDALLNAPPSSNPHILPSAMPLAAVTAPTHNRTRSTDSQNTLAEAPPLLDTRYQMPLFNIDSRKSVWDDVDLEAGTPLVAEAQAVASRTRSGSGAPVPVGAGQNLVIGGVGYYGGFTIKRKQVGGGTPRIVTPEPTPEIATKSAEAEGGTSFAEEPTFYPIYPAMSDMSRKRSSEMFFADPRLIGKEF